MKEAMHCPFCALVIVLDPAACKMVHEAPVCARFDAGMRAAGMNAKHEPWVAVIIKNEGRKPEP